MRIAVCISGQLRKWKIAAENQKWFWTTANFPDVQVDYFGHTWTYSGDREGVLTLNYTLLTFVLS